MAGAPCHAGGGVGKKGGRLVGGMAAAAPSGGGRRRGRLTCVGEKHLPGADLSLSSIPPHVSVLIPL